MTRTDLRTAQLAGIIASLAVLVATTAIGGVLTPGYSQMADTVSRLGSPGQPAAWFARAGFVLYGLLVAAGAGAVGDQAPDGRRALAWLLRGYAVAAVVAGLASKDPPGPVHTTASQVHVAATVVGGAMVVAAMVLVARRSADRTTRLLAWSGAVVTLVGAAVFRASWGSSYYGLVERVLLGSAALWVASLAWNELRPGMPSRYPFQDRARRALR